jgi:hypothetical protein
VSTVEVAKLFMYFKMVVLHYIEDYFHQNNLHHQAGDFVGFLNEVFEMVIWFSRA